MTLMQSRKDEGRNGSGPLLAGAPVVDPTTGLHGEDCACARCQLGYGPTREERWRARAALARAAARAKALDEAARIREKAKTKAEVTAALLRQDEADTRERLAAQLAPVKRPATAAELEELKRQYFPRRRTHHG
jgi:hypothetical protein